MRRGHYTSSGSPVKRVPAKQLWVYELLVDKSSDAHSDHMATFTAKGVELLDSAGHFANHFTQDQVLQVRDYWKKSLLSLKHQPQRTQKNIVNLSSLLWATKPHTWQEPADPVLVSAWCDFSAAYSSTTSWGLTPTADSRSSGGQSKNRNRSTCGTGPSGSKSKTTGNQSPSSHLW